MLTRFAARLFNKPLLVDQAYLTTFISAVSDKVGVDTINVDGSLIGKIEMASRAQGYSSRSDRKPYVVSNGTAIIDVSGTLVNKNGYLTPSSGLMGYDGIEGQFGMALDDENVDTILFDINSPGGEVAGCFDLADLIYEFRSEKRVVGFAGEQATSGAYAILSSCSEVYTPRTGVLSSIGVVMAHTDASKKMENQGVNVTLIHSGRHKVDGNPYEQLSDEVRLDLQGKLDNTRLLFAETVARNRGMKVSEVLATEAQVYTGAEAVKLGLADAVMSFNEVLQKMSIKGKTVVEQGATASSETKKFSVGLVPGREKVTTTVGEIQVEEFVGGTLDQVFVSSPILDASAVLKACDEKGISFLASSFVDMGMSQDGLDKALAEVTGIRDICVAANVDTDTVLKNYGNPVELVRCCLDKSISDEEEVDSTLVPKGEDETNKLMSTTELYAQRNKH